MNEEINKKYFKNTSSYYFRKMNHILNDLLVTKGVRIKYDICVFERFNRENNSEQKSIRQLHPVG